VVEFVIGFECWPDLVLATESTGGFFPRAVAYNRTAVAKKSFTPKQGPYQAARGFIKAG
jgi:hypothetical protein